MINFMSTNGPDPLCPHCQDPYIDEDGDGTFRPQCDCGRYEENPYTPCSGEELGRAAERSPQPTPTSRPAFHVDQELRDAGKKAADTFAEECWPDIEEVLEKVRELKRRVKLCSCLIPRGKCGANSCCIHSLSSGKKTDCHFEENFLDIVTSYESLHSQLASRKQQEQNDLVRMKEDGETIVALRSELKAKEEENKELKQAMSICSGPCHQYLEKGTYTNLQEENKEQKKKLDAYFKDYEESQNSRFELMEENERLQKAGKIFQSEAMQCFAEDDFDRFLDASHKFSEALSQSSNDES